MTEVCSVQWDESSCLFGNLNLKIEGGLNFLSIHYFLFVNSKVCFVLNLCLPAYSKKSVQQIIASSGFTVHQRKCEKADYFCCHIWWPQTLVKWKFLTWFSSLREQNMTVWECTSRWSPFLGTVPQGSCFKCQEKWITEAVLRKKLSG